MGRHSFIESARPTKAPSSSQSGIKMHFSLRYLGQVCSKALKACFGKQLVCAWSITLTGPQGTRMVHTGLSGSDDQTLKAMVQILNREKYYLFNGSKEGKRGLRVEDLEPFYSENNLSAYAGYQVILKFGGMFKLSEAWRACDMRVRLVPANEIQLQVDYKTKHE